MIDLNSQNVLPARKPVPILRKAISRILHFYKISTFPKPYQKAWTLLLPTLLLNDTFYVVNEIALWQKVWYTEPSRCPYNVSWFPIYRKSLTIWIEVFYRSLFVCVHWEQGLGGFLGVTFTAICEKNCLFYVNYHCNVIVKRSL